MRFSIVTPVYNAAKYIERTVCSVLVQTLPDWEMVCVDDGSSDASGQILDGLAAKDSRIKVVHQPNGGEGAARNAALRVATGDWIVFLDADDLLSPWALAEHARVVDQCPEAMMTRLGMIQFDGDADPDWNAVKNAGQRIWRVNVRDVIPFEMSVAHFFQFAYSRSILNGLEYTSHYVGADRVFLIKCLLKSDCIGCSTAISHAYRQTPTSIMGSCMTLRRLRDRQSYIHECIEQVKGSSKRLSKTAIREFGSTLTECSVYDIGTLPKGERSEAWALWQSWLPWIASLDDLPFWRRMSVAICRCMLWAPSHLVPRFLFELPYRMKLAGFHR